MYQLSSLRANASSSASPVKSPVSLSLDCSESSSSSSNSSPDPSSMSSSSSPLSSSLSSFCCFFLEVNFCFLGAGLKKYLDTFLKHRQKQFQMLVEINYNLAKTCKNCLFLLSSVGWVHHTSIIEKKKEEKASIRGYTSYFIDGISLIQLSWIIKLMD